MKYYLRGLGFGILITTLVFAMLGERTPSDAEILRRAEELGYTKADISATPMLNLDALKEQLTKTPGLTLTQVPEGQLTITPKPTPEPTLEPDFTPEPAPSEPPEENQGEAVTAVIEVKKGMTSSQVCKLLEDTGIIEDWSEFNRYMAERRLTNSINIGKFTLSSTMDHKEIAHVLTGK